MKEKKEKITLPPLKEIKEEEEHVNNIAENNENNNKSLFGNLPITNTEKDKKEEKDNYNPTSLFSGSPYLMMLKEVIIISVYLVIIMKKKMIIKQKLIYLVNWKKSQITK